ncbi:MAG: flagellar biosynthetic protein FliO [Deltaproteobacteria bacterium HGW-Deltaproteobacteria-19]|nr:MAG: flagellar biosynthetic protein FliO [Deltaproteobacteria bacterium HGW-Deltaproteobacteria-19]
MDFSFFSALLKMLFALAIVLGLLIGSVYFLKKFMAPAGGGDEGQAIRILATRSLGPKSSILVVDILGKVVALGVTGAQISVLTDLDDPSTLDRLRPQGGAPASPLPMTLDRYRKMLKSFASSRKGGKP